MQFTWRQPSLPPSCPHQRRNASQGAACTARQIRSSTVCAASNASGGRRGSAEPKQQIPEKQPPAAAVAGEATSYFPLVLVSLLWGSYTPALRYLYSMDSLLTPQVLTAHRTVISAVALLSASVMSIIYSKYQLHAEHEKQMKRQLEAQQQLQLQQHQQSTAAAVLGLLQHWLPDWLQPQSKSSSSSSSAVGATEVVTGSNKSSSSSSEDAGSTTATAAAVLAAGLELGVWNFLGTSSQAIGLELSTATKAAFLTQTTAVFTPCLAVLCGQAVSPAHWVACIVALLGSCCITLDSLIDVSAYRAPDPTPPGVEAAAAPAAVNVVPGSTSSSTQFSMVAAPDLQDDEQQQIAATTATAVSGSLSDQSSSSEFFDSSNNSAMGASAMADASSAAYSVDGASAGIGTVVPAVSCSPTATPPQGVVPAIACAPVATATSMPSTNSSIPAVTGKSNSSSSSPSVAKLTPSSQRQQQQQQAPTSVQSNGALLQASHSSAAASDQPHQQQPEVTAVAAAIEDTHSSSSSSFSGELYILLACCCYAIATVRLSMLAPGLNPVHLATSKTLALAAASLCWLLAFQSGNVTSPAAAAAAAAVEAEADGGALKESVAAALASAAEAWQLPETFTHGKGMLLLVYSALGPGALAAVMQAKGQSTVSAAEAQVFYSLTPVWAALMAMLLLQGEEMGPLAWIGGAVIVAASIGAAVSDRNGTDSGNAVGGEQWEGK